MGEYEKGDGDVTVASKPPIVSAPEWEAALGEMLVKEKELTRARDALAAQRRRMPWLPVTTRYEFDGPQGKVSLLDLFEGRRQLIVYRAFSSPACTAGPITLARAAQWWPTRWPTSPTSTHVTPASRSSRGRLSPTSPG